MKSNNFQLNDLQIFNSDNFTEILSENFRFNVSKASDILASKVYLNIHYALFFYSLFSMQL